MTMDLESAMNRTYELMFIVRPDMMEEDQDKLISTLETAVTSSGGQVKNMEKMGKRRLVYMVRRFHEGLLLLLTFEGSGVLVHDLELRLRVPAGASISAAKRCASSAPKRSKRSITKTCACWRSSSPKAARLCLGD